MGTQKNQIENVEREKKTEILTWRVKHTWSCLGAFFLEGLAGFTGASSSESAKRSSSSEPAFFSGSCLGRENTLKAAIKDFQG